MTGKPLQLSFVTSLSTTSAITSARMCPIPLHAIPTCATMLGDDAGSWTGSQTSYDNAAIETNVTGWGLSCNKWPAVHVGTPLKINLSTPPTLQAVPVKASDASPAKEPFLPGRHYGGLPMSLKRIFHCAAALAAVLLTPNVQAQTTCISTAIYSVSPARWWFRARCQRKCISPRSAVEI